MARCWFFSFNVRFTVEAAVQEHLFYLITSSGNIPDVLEIFGIFEFYTLFLHDTEQTWKPAKYTYSSTTRKPSFWRTLWAWFIFKDRDDLETNCIFSAVSSVALRFGHFSCDIDRLLIEGHIPLLFLLSSSILFVLWHLKNHHLLVIIQTRSSFYFHWSDISTHKLLTRFNFDDLKIIKRYTPQKSTVLIANS